MKKMISFDLTKVSEGKIGDLKIALDSFVKHPVAGFLSQELLARRDSVLWNPEMPPAEKVGALKQITELTDLLYGVGARALHQIMEKRMQPKGVPGESMDSEKFKQKVMK